MPAIGNHSLLHHLMGFCYWWVARTRWWTRSLTRLHYLTTYLSACWKMCTMRQNLGKMTMRSGTQQTDCQWVAFNMFVSTKVDNISVLTNGLGYEQRCKHLFVWRAANINITEIGVLYLILSQLLHLLVPWLWIGQSKILKNSTYSSSLTDNQETKIMIPSWQYPQWHGTRIEKWSLAKITPTHRWILP